MAKKSLAKYPFRSKEWRAYWFWVKVAITADDSRCWEWQGCVHHKGYGQTSYFGKQQAPHRVAWQIVYGVEPKMLLHSCDNRLCVNPKHLREGDHAENSRDCIERGRTTRGELAHRSKLNANQVMEIRELSSRGISDNQLARDYGVYPNTIRGIRIGHTWRHITGGTPVVRRTA